MTALGLVDVGDARLPTMPVAVKRVAGPALRATDTRRVVYAEKGASTTPIIGCVAVDVSFSHGSSPSIG